MSADLRLDNILIQVTSRLRENGIKLWLEPYHTDEFGTCTAELEVFMITFYKFQDVLVKTKYHEYFSEIAFNDVTAMCFTGFS